MTADGHSRLVRFCTLLLSLSVLGAFSAIWPASAQPHPRPPARPPEFGPSFSTKPAPVPAPANPAPQSQSAPASPPTASSVTVTKTEAPKPLTPATPQAEVLKRVNAALNASPYFSAYFTQLVGNRQSEGQVYVMKPGKLRFDYDPPVPTEIIADGSSVAVRDTKMATQDIYPIGQTPLKFLTRDQIDLGRDLKVTGLRVDPDRVIVGVEDQSTFAGTSKVTLFFEQPSLLLKQWIVIDPQGVEISVVLNEINTKDRPDPKLFVIDYQIIK